jgi:hypothetical protein
MKKRTGILFTLLLSGHLAMAQGYVITRKVKEPTRGSRYFFFSFARGFIINAKGELVKKPGYFYDYDKVNGQLLVKPLDKPIVAASKADVQSFTLYDRQQNAFVFERVPAIDTQRFVQVLSLGLKYKIYKLINTRFVSANYRDDGISHEGNKYDEFVDEGTYYVLNVESNTLQKLSLKIKSLYTVFDKDQDKLNKFISLHPSDTIGDVYLASLGAFMNN